MRQTTILFSDSLQELSLFTSIKILVNWGTGVIPPFSSGTPHLLSPSLNQPKNPQTFSLFSTTMISPFLFWRTFLK